MWVVGNFVCFMLAFFLNFFCVGNVGQLFFCLSERATTGVCWSMIRYLVLNEGKNYLGIRNLGFECEWPRFYLMTTRVFLWLRNVSFSHSFL